jgi:serine/threonine protein kinase
MKNQQKILGQGTYSDVIEIRGLAVKRISIENLESAIREICILQACAHENIINIINIEYTPTHVNISMPLYECDLRVAICKNIIFTTDSIYSISKDIVVGTNYIHRLGIIHGDIKPHNILIRLNMAGTLQTICAVLCDFGLSVLSIENLHTSKIQTCTYRAPEIDETIKFIHYTDLIDVWSIGCILFELVTGKALIKYEKDNEDSSDYVCKLFQLTIAQNIDRKGRVEILDQLPSETIYRKIKKKIRRTIFDSPNIYHEIYNNGFIETIAGCLTPNINKRLSSRHVYYTMQYICNNIPCSTTLTPLKFIPVDIDEMSVVENVPIEIISSCSEESLWLAEKIYNKLHHANVGLKLASLYIASCLFSGNRYAIANIENMDLQTISLVYFVMQSFQILKKTNNT